jgi:hypothetical protein
MWLEQNEGLIAGLVRLRQLPRSDRAVREVLAVPEVRQARLSWELWETLVLGHGDEPERLLLGRVPFGLIEQARLAFWGSGPNRSLCVSDDEQC